MILSGDKIRELIESGSIIVDPKPAEEQYDTSSLDLRLGKEFLQYKSEIVKELRGVERAVFNPDAFDFQEIADLYMQDVEHGADDSVILEPGQLMFSNTLEKVYLPIKSGLAARIEEALDDLSESVSIQISFAHSKGQPDMIRRPAEPIYFQLFSQVRNQLPFKKATES